MTKHKWHKEIKAWADGAEIEYKINQGDWNLAPYPNFHTERYEYRIKPQPKEPQYLYVYDHGGAGFSWQLGRLHGWDNIYIGKIKLEVDDD